MENNKVDLLPLHVKKMQPKYAKEILIMDSSCEAKFLFHIQDKCENKITKSIAITNNLKKIEMYYLCSAHYQKFLQLYKEVEITDLSKVKNQKIINDKSLNLKSETKRIINLVQEVPEKQETRITVFMGNKYNPGLKKAETNKSHLIEINEQGEKIWIKNEQVWDKLKDLTEKEWLEYKNKPFDRNKNIVANYKVINIKHNWKYVGFDAEGKTKDFLGKNVAQELKQYTIKIRQQFEEKQKLEKIKTKNINQSLKNTGGI